MKTILIDVHGVAHAVRHALPQMTVQDHGSEVIYGFLQHLQGMASYYKTSKFVFCWDVRHSLRKRMYPRYKTRPVDKSQEDSIRNMHIQLNLLRTDILPRIGFRNQFRQNGYEADDMIAWIVKNIPGFYVIVSSDGDLYQLLDHVDHMFLFGTKKKFDRDDFIAKYGFPPSRWAEAKALMGCPSDTVAGVTGIGEALTMDYLNDRLQGLRLKKWNNARNKPTFQEEYDLALKLVELPLEGVNPIQIVKEKFYKEDFLGVLDDLEISSLKVEVWEALFDME